MKFLRWVHKRSPLTDALRSDQHNAGRHWHGDPLYSLSEEKVQATATVNAGHTEVLTVGTLGIGSLLNGKMEKEGLDADNTDDADDDLYGDEAVMTTSHSDSTSLSRNSWGSGSESVRSAEVRKLQEELQKILSGEADWWPSTSASKEIAACAKGGKAKGKKQKTGREEERGSAASSVRELLPLHNSFVEYSSRSGMCSQDKGSRATEGSFFRKLFVKYDRGVLLEWLKSNFYSSSSPSPNLDMAFTAVSAAKVIGWRRGKIKKGCETQHKNPNQGNFEKDRRRLELARCYKESGRKVDMIDRAISKFDGANYLKSSSYKDGQHGYSYTFQVQKRPNLKLLISMSSFLTNESWINSDDEYLVLEL